MIWQVSVSQALALSFVPHPQSIPSGHPLGAKFGLGLLVEASRGSLATLHPSSSVGSACFQRIWSLKSTFVSYSLSGREGRFFLALHPMSWSGLLEVGGQSVIQFVLFDGSKIVTAI